MQNSPINSWHLKIFIGGIPANTTREELFDHFKQYGVILDLVIIKDKQTHNPRGFGFVTYQDEDSFENALKDKHFFHGKEIELKRALPRDQNPKELLKKSQESRKLFVGGLPKNLQLEEFTDYFEKYGEIEDIAIIGDKLTKEPRGFGFVTYVNIESVYTVLREYQTHYFGDKWVEVKLAHPRFEGVPDLKGVGNSTNMADAMN